MITKEYLAFGMRLVDTEHDILDTMLIHNLYDVFIRSVVQYSIIIPYTYNSILSYIIKKVEFENFRFLLRSEPRKVST